MTIPPGGSARGLEGQILDALQALKRQNEQIEASMKELSQQINGPPAESSLTWRALNLSKEQKEVVKILESERAHRAALAAKLDLLIERVTALEVGAEGSATSKLKARIDEVDAKSKIDVTRILVTALTSVLVVAAAVGITWAVMKGG